MRSKKLLFYGELHPKTLGKSYICIIITRFLTMHACVLQFLVQIFSLNKQVIVM